MCAFCVEIWPKCDYPPANNIFLSFDLRRENWHCAPDLWHNWGTLSHIKLLIADNNGVKPNVVAQQHLYLPSSREQTNRNFVATQSNVRIWRNPEGLVTWRYFVLRHQYLVLVAIKSNMAPKAIRKSSPTRSRLGTAGAFVMDFYRNPTKW